MYSTRGATVGSMTCFLPILILLLFLILFHCSYQNFLPFVFVQVQDGASSVFNSMAKPFLFAAAV